MEDINQFDKLSDDLLRLIFNRVIDANSLCWCLSVSKRFSTVAPGINTVAVQIPRRRENVVKVSEVSKPEDEKVGLSLSEKFMRFIVGFFVVRPILFVYRSIVRTSSEMSSSDDTNDESDNTVAIQAVDEYMKRFNEIETMEIRLPSCGGGETGFNGSDSLLKWKAEFGKELKNCVIICATSVEESNQTEFEPEVDEDVDCSAKVLSENSIEEFDHTESVSLGSDELMPRIMLTISSLVAASTRHFSLRQMIRNRSSLRGIVVSDEKRRGVLCMNEEQITEMRNCLNSVERSKAWALDVDRTRVPALNVNMCYVPVLELPKTRKVMKGATLILIRAVESVKSVKINIDRDRDLVQGVFSGDADENMLNEAVNIMINTTTTKNKFTMEINSF